MRNGRWFVVRVTGQGMRPPDSFRYSIYEVVNPLEEPLPEDLLHSQVVLSWVDMERGAVRGLVRAQRQTGHIHAVREICLLCVPIVRRMFIEGELERRPRPHRPRRHAEKFRQIRAVEVLPRLSSCPSVL